VTGSQRPDEAGKDGGDRPASKDDGELERRGRSLDAALAARKAASKPQGGPDNTRGVTGFGNALRLSSEFIAGIVVGAGIGWFFDRFAGTSPWGLIVFLLLGFAAGVFNVLRASGQMAEFGARDRDGQGRN
jgi:ATP synthase protein I